MQGGVGEKAVRNILGQAIKIADRSLPMDAEHLKKLSGDIQVTNQAETRVMPECKVIGPFKNELFKSLNYF